MCDTGAFDGVALSPGVLDGMAAAGTVIQRCRWRYGDAFRAHPFPPHRRLAGVFTSPDGRAQGWYPGDHKGCLCSIVPTLCRLPGAITAAMDANPCAPPELAQVPRPPANQVLTDEQWAALNPQRFRNYATAWDEVSTALPETADGKELLDTLSKWIQGDRSLAPIRSTVGKLLAGEAGTTPLFRKAFNLLRALKESPYQAPESLYRGLFLKGKDVDRLIAKHFGDGAFDMNISSWSANRGRAATYANVGRQKFDYVEVIMEWRGPKQAMSVQNAAGNTKAYADAEWIGAGRFRVLEAKAVGGKIRVVVEQVAGI